MKTISINQVSRACASTCLPSHINGVKTSCCTSDYCNSSRSQLRMSHHQVIFGLGLLAVSYLLIARAWTLFLNSLQIYISRLINPSGLELTSWLLKFCFALSLISGSALSHQFVLSNILPLFLGKERRKCWIILTRFVFLFNQLCMRAVHLSWCWSRHTYRLPHPISIHPIPSLSLFRPNMTTSFCERG